MLSALLFISFLSSVQPALSAQRVPPPWVTSGYCNAPHVNVSHYQPPPEGAHLVHLSIMMRHHKRAPVSLVPDERAINDGIEWDCSDVKQFTYDGGGARLSHSVTTSSDHPFARQIWAGDCEEGQLTADGFYDSRVHGKDLWELYHDRLGFLRVVDPSEISVRTTYIDRTKHVASGVLAGMDPSTIGRRWAIYTQPQKENSMVPSYKCPRADALLAAAKAAPSWQNILEENSALKERLDSVLGTKDYKAMWPSSFTFYQDVLTSRVCHDHPLPCNGEGECVSEDDAVKIFELGDFEVDYLWNQAKNATEFNQLTFGVMFSELADALSSPAHRLSLYVAHDTSLVRLASGLGIFPLWWPRLGSEIVIEVWHDAHLRPFVRVIYDGEVIKDFSWVPLEDFINYLRHQAPDNLFERCADVSGDAKGIRRPLVPFTVQSVV